MSTVPVAAVLSAGPAVVAIVAFAIGAVLEVWLIPRRQRAGWQRAGFAARRLLVIALEQPSLHQRQA